MHKNGGANSSAAAFLLVFAEHADVVASQHTAFEIGGDARQVVGEGDKAGQVSLRPRLEINDAAAAINAAQSGEGITTVLCYMVGERIRSGALVPILKHYWPALSPVQIIFPHRRLLAAKVRAFVDYATPRLREPLSTYSTIE